jgi:SAM-dependent methyltransferase
MKEKRNPGAINYFNRKIESFDNIYRSERKGVGPLLNNTLRASVRQRFKLAFDLLGDMRGKSVLDVGCGTGRYMFESIRRGAKNVMGIDAAPGAIEAARKMASHLDLKDKAQFNETDFLDFDPKNHFDIVFAVGYFDYILNPKTHIQKMFEISNEFLYISFPKLWHPLTPARKLRLFLNRCPVRFYSKKKIRELMNFAGFTDFEIKSVARDYILIVRKPVAPRHSEMDDEAEI